MSSILKALAAAAFLASGASIAAAQTQTEPPAKSKTEPGAVQQGPSPQTPGSAATGAAPGAPAATQTPGAPPNPTGMSKEKQNSDSNDPQQGGKKQ